MAMNEEQGGFQMLSGMVRSGQDWENDAHHRFAKYTAEDIQKGFLLNFISTILDQISSTGGSPLLDAFNKIFNGRNGIKYGTSINNINYSGSNADGFNYDIQKLSKNIFGAYLLAAISVGTNKINVTHLNNSLNSEGVTTMSADNQEVNIAYNQSASNGDMVYFTSSITLGHELFHGLDLIAWHNNKENIVMSHYRDHEALSPYYKEESAKMFDGNDIRLYMESRAVAYENLIRAGEKGQTNQYRIFYAPFNDATESRKLVFWIAGWQVNVMANQALNFTKQ